MKEYTGAGRTRTRRRENRMVVGALDRDIESFDGWDAVAGILPVEGESWTLDQG